MKSGETIGIKKLNSEFGRHATRVLSEFIKEEDHKRGAPRKFKVVKDLPTKEEYQKLFDEHYKTNISDLVECARDEVSSLAEELRSWYDGMPENFQNGDKGGEVEEAASSLEGIDIPDVPDCLIAGNEECKNENDVILVHAPDIESSNSRSSRAGEAASCLRDVIERIHELVEKYEKSDDVDLRDSTSEISSFADDLENAADEIDGVSFPGMY